MGFWAGWVCVPFLLFQENWGIEVYLFPFVSSCFCWYADSIITLIHEKTYYLSSGSSTSSSSVSTPDK